MPVSEPTNAVQTNSPSASDRIWDSASDAYNDGKYAEAKPLFEQYAALKPDEGETYYWLGLCLNELVRTNDAEKAFRQCIKLDPKYGDAYDQLVSILVDEERLKESVPYERFAIDLEGETEARDAVLAYGLNAGHEYVKATNLLFHSIALYPSGNFDAFSCLAQALHGLGQNVRAKWYAQKAIELKPNSEYSNLVLGDVLYGLREFNAAADAYKKALQLNPRQASTHFWRGWTLLKAHRDREAIVELEVAHNLQPRNVNWVYCLFAAYCQTGSYAQALSNHPVAWTLAVAAVLIIGVGGFLALAVVSLLSAESGPGILVSLLWIALFFTAGVTAELLVGFVPFLHSPNIQALGLMLAPLPILFLTLVLYRAFPWGAPYALWNLPKQPWIRGVVGYFLVRAFTRFFAHTPSLIKSRSTLFIAELVATNPISAFFLSVLIQPMAEEVMWRGMLYPALRKHIGLWAIPVTSALFAACHFDMPHFLPLFGFGLLLAWTREISGGVWLPFVFHALNNGWVYYQLRLHPV